MAERVCIPNADQTHPTYHRIGKVTEGRSGWVWATACNVALVDETYGIRSIRHERAELFARPCRRCFGEEAQYD